MVAELRQECPVGALQVDGDEIHRRGPDELGDEEVDRPVVERRGHVELLQQPVAHDGDAVAERHRLDLVVRNVDRGHLQVALQPGDLGPHLDAELRVQVRERLIHQKRLGLTHDRPAHRDALPLATRQRAGALLQHAAQSQDPCRALDPRRDRALGHLLHLESKRHVRVGGHMRVESVILEDHRDVAALGRDAVHDSVAEPDPAIGDLLEPRDHAQRGGLAAA